VFLIALSIPKYASSISVSSAGGLIEDISLFKSSRTAMSTLILF